MDKPTGHRQSRKPRTTQINLRIDNYFLERIDKAAKQDFTTRSELIRIAVYWFLMPLGYNLHKNEEDYILKTVQYRRRLASTRQWLKERGHEIDAYDS